MEDKENSNINKKREGLLYSDTTRENSKETKSKRAKIHNKYRFKYTKEYSDHRDIWDRLEGKGSKILRDKVYRRRFK